MKALDQIRARLEAATSNQWEDRGLAQLELVAHASVDIDRLLRALEYTRCRAHHYAQLAENYSRDNRIEVAMSADRANAITDAEIEKILNGEE